MSSSSSSSSDSSSPSPSPVSSPCQARPTITPAKPTVKRGQLRDGKWYCECEPRKYATLRTTTKPGENIGRKFWSCPINPEEGNRCNFFIWLNEAEERQKECFLSNNRSEKRQTTLHETFTPRKERRGSDEKTRATGVINNPEPINGGASVSAAAASPSPPPSAPPPRGTNGPSATVGSSTLKESNEGASPPNSLYDTTSDEDDVVEIENPMKAHLPTNNANYQKTSTMAHNHSKQPPAASSKRKRSADDDDYLSDLSEDAEVELIARLEMSTGKGKGKFTTDRINTRQTRNKDDPFVTPSLKRTTLDNNNGMMPTPSLTKGKSTKKVLFPDAESSSTRHGENTAKRQRLGSGFSSTPHGTISKLLFGSDATIPSPLPPPPPPPPPPPRTQSSSSSSGSGSGSGPSPPKSSTDLVKEVMSLLKDVEMTKAVHDKVRKTLQRHAAQNRELDGRVGRLEVSLRDAEDRRAALRGRLLDLYQEF